MSEHPLVELLWWRGCPSVEQAAELVRTEMDRLGIDSSSLRVREIRDQEQSDREDFVGSPTIRVAGRDIEDPAEAPRGLTCRVYRLRDGRISALPDRADVAAALAAALKGADA